MSEVFNIGINGHNITINLDVMAKAKVLFNMAIVVPDENLLNIAENAHLLISLVRQGEELHLSTETKSELLYFAQHWLYNEKDYVTSNHLDLLEIEIASLIEDTNNYLAEKYLAQIKKEENRKIECNRLREEKKSIVEKAKELLNLDVKEMPQDYYLLFKKIDEVPRIEEMKTDWLYDLIVDESIANVVFLRAKRFGQLKAKFIVSAINKGDYLHAEKLIDLLIMTVSYKDFCQNNSWERDFVLSIKYFLEAFCLDNYSPRKLNKEVSDNTKRQCVILAEKAMKYLSSETQKELLGELAILDNTKEYEKRYIENLLLDVVNYHKKPRPKGWGNPKVTNRIQLEMNQAMRYLPLLKRFDALLEILTIMKKADSSFAHSLEQNLSRLQYYLSKDELDELKSHLV